MTPPLLGRCPRCKAWVHEVGKCVGLWSGRGGAQGGVYQTRCFICQATLQAFHDSCDERWMDEEWTAADLEWELIDDKRKVGG